MHGAWPRTYVVMDESRGTDRYRLFVRLFPRMCVDRGAPGPLMSRKAKSGPGAPRSKIPASGRRAAGHPGIRKACVACSWAYALLVLLWFILHLSVGDGLWWLALANSFAPFLFVPAALQLIIGALIRKRPVWASTVAPLAIFLFLYGGLFLPARRPELEPGATPITVMSFNIWGLSRSQGTARAVREAGPVDLVVLQELSPHMVDVLKAELGSEYPYQAIEIGGRAYGLGVFSRHPLAKLNAGRLVDPLSPVQILRVTRGGETYVLYNVHLQASNVLVQVDTGGSLADYTRAGIYAREAQVQRLVADIATRTEPVLVAGDFNSTDRSDGYQLLARELTDAHRAVGWGWGHTFPAYGGSWRGLPIPARLTRLDMIFCSKELVPVACRVASAHGESDHLPVVAQLAWDR